MYAGWAMLKLLAVTVAFLVATPCVAADWYLAAGSSCSGTMSVAAAANTLLPSGFALVGTGRSGNFAFKVTPSQYNAVVSAQPSRIATHTLAVGEATSLRAAMMSAADAKVPMFFKAGVSFLANLTLTNALTNVASNFVFDEIYKALDVSAVRNELVAGYVAGGGRLVRLATIAKRGDERYLTQSTLYEVVVGEEMRSFVLYSCVAPVALSISQFTTLGPFNNKVVKPKNGQLWGVWDLTDSKWDSTELRILEEQPTFYVFLQDEVQNNIIVGQTTVHLSTNGGPWQRKRSNETLYKTLYANLAVD